MAVTTNIQAPPQFIQDLAQDYGTQLVGLTSVPIDTSKFAPHVAAQDPLQTQAVSLAQQGIGSYQPFLHQAQTTLAGAQGLLGSGAGTGTGTISDFMSPFQSQVIDTTLAEFDRQRAINEQNIRDQQAALGALGSGRAGVQLSEFQSQSGRDRAALEAQLRQQGFQQAQAARQQDIQNRFGLAQAQSGLGQFQTGLAAQVPQLQRADISTLGQVGAAQQAQRQAVLDAQRQAARTAAYEPLERLGFFGQGVTGLMGGYPAQYQFQATPPASPLQTALGLGTGIAGIFGALR